MNIRTAKLEDLGAIVHIYNQAIAAGQKTADIKPVTVDEAIGKCPVKVYLKDKRSIKLKNLIKDNESFLGQTGNMLKIEYQTIPSNDIRYVRLKNRAVSTILTFALFGGIAAVPVIAVISIHETSRNGWVINGGFN